MHLRVARAALSHQLMLARADNRPPSSADQEPYCTSNILDWILLVATLLLFCGSWWICEVPIFFSRNTYYKLQPSTGKLLQRGRLWRFWHTIEWNCTRTIMPSYVAVVAMARNPDPKTWMGLYYFGSQRESRDKTPFTSWQWAKVLLMDGVAIVVHILLVYRGATGLETPLPPSVWLLSYLVAPLLGLYLFIIGKFRRPVWRRFAITAAIPVLLIAGAVLVLLSYFTTPDKGFGFGGAFVGIMAGSLVVTMLPWSLMLCCGGKFHFIFYLWTACARVIPFTVSHVGSPTKYPFCANGSIPVAIVSGVMGGALVYMLGFMGGFQCEMYRRDLEEMIDIDPAAPRNDGNSGGELEALQAAESAPINGDQGQSSGLGGDPSPPVVKKGI